MRHPKGYGFVAGIDFDNFGLKLGVVFLSLVGSSLNKKESKRRSQKIPFDMTQMRKQGLKTGIHFRGQLVKQEWKMA